MEEHTPFVKRKRHLAKAITYRIIGSLFNASVAYFITHERFVAGMIFIADSIGKIVLYYVHERVWYRIKWGTSKE